VLGKEHRDTLVAMDIFAWTYRDQGRQKKVGGAAMFKSCRRVRGVDGEEHPDIQVVAANLW